MPPKGYKLGYIKNKETGEYVHPGTLAPPTPPVLSRTKPLTKTIQVDIASDVPSLDTSRDNLGPVTHTIKDDREYAKIIIVWRDAKGKERTTAYIMANLSINENIDEKFTETARKQTRIHISLEGDVLERQ